MPIHSKPSCHSRWLRVVSLALSALASGCANPAVESGATCGDGRCDPSENAQSCSGDCAPCLGLGAEGCCDDGVRVYCFGGTVRREACGASGCGWSGSEYRCGFSGSAQRSSLPQNCGCAFASDGALAGGGAVVEGAAAEVLPCATAGQRLAVGALLEPITGLPVCTGTAIADRVVVTAAHCVLPGDDAFALPPDVVFSVGLSVAEPEYVFTVAQSLPDPDYDGSVAHDVALLILDEAISAVLPHVEPLTPLLDPPAVEWVGSLAHVAGYGIDEAGGAPASQQAWTTERVSSVSPELMVVESDPSMGLCDGDSGAPLLRVSGGGAPRLVGVLSAGSSNCVGEDHFAPLALARELLEPELATEPACGAIDAAGRCNGGIAQWCEGGELAQECCVFGCERDEEGLSRCLTPEEICRTAEDGSTACGEGQLLRCEAGLPSRTLCAACGEGGCIEGAGEASCSMP